MDKEKKPLGEVLPDEEKKNRDDYPDHLKSPLHGIEDRRKTLHDAENDDKES